MGYFDKKGYTRVTLPSDNNYWVDVYSDFDYSDVKRVENIDNPLEASDKTLEIAVKQWNLDDKEGKILDITPESINLIRKDDVIAIMETIKREVGEAGEKKASSK